MDDRGVSAAGCNGATAARGSTGADEAEADLVRGVFWESAAVGWDSQRVSRGLQEPLQQARSFGSWRAENLRNYGTLGFCRVRSRGESSGSNRVHAP